MTGPSGAPADAETPPRVSVIICTRNRANALRESLESVRVAASSGGPYAELVVVDNGSTDGTSELVEAWARDVPPELPVRLVREPRTGLSIARNTGVAAARGEIILFTDDDCRLEPDYLLKLADVYADQTGPIIIGGRVELGDPRDLPMTIKTSREPATFDGVDVGAFVIGSNLTLSRATWSIVGLMDERFGAGTNFKASEETDYLHRAHLAGIPILYRPDLCVHHFHGRRTIPEVKKLWRNYSIGNGALYAKYFGTPLARQFLWNCKNAVKELFGAAKLDPELGLTYRDMAIGNVDGMIRYWRAALASGRSA
ncbi:MAG: glycosyltransferase family 2 protein [Alphaproteobacteria bacterium]